MTTGQPADPLIGTCVDAKYEIVRLLGCGGMGRVYLARHRFLESDCVVKVLHAHLALDEAYLERFRREARIASRLKNPHAVTVYDFGVDEFPYVVMELVEGETLASLLEREPLLPLPRIRSIIRDVARALVDAHALGIVHRDLKPENIMLRQVPSGGEHVYVLDFGVAKLLPLEGDQSQTISAAGELMGTPKYMSPEQALQKECDERADIYSLGVLCYELLTGELPFRTQSVIDTIYHHVHEIPAAPSTRCEPGRVPEKLDAVVLRMLAKDPEERFASMAEVLDEFTGAIDRDLLFLDDQSHRSFIPGAGASRWRVGAVAAGGLAAMFIVVVASIRYFTASDSMIPGATPPATSSLRSINQPTTMAETPAASNSQRPSPDAVSSSPTGIARPKSAEVAPAPPKKNASASATKTSAPSRAARTRELRPPQQSRASDDAESLRREAERWMQAERLATSPDDF
ncbi:MAG: protein kinase [Bdellovibrionales bacterium]|nr:protein kinase [Bdellovibrionales bacterium]